MSDNLFLLHSFSYSLWVMGKMLKCKSLISKLLAYSISCKVKNCTLKADRAENKTC